MPHVERTLNGVKIPSVTEVLKGQEEPEFLVAWRARMKKKNPRWGEKWCVAKTNRGARIGTDTHEILDWFLSPVNFWQNRDCGYVSDCHHPGVYHTRTCKGDCLRAELSGYEPPVRWDI